MHKKTISLFLVPLAVACGGESGSGQPPEGTTPGGDVRSVDEGDGVTATQVDASDQQAWIYFDLDAGQAVEVEDPGAVPEWDLAFRRSNMKLNGGHSGPGSVEVAPLPGAEFASIDRAPVAVYRVDEPATGEVDPDRPSFIDDDGTDFALGRANDASVNGWYDYDPVNHVLSPSAVVFALRSSEGAFFKLRFLDYYSEAGASGFPTFRWAAIQPPDDAPLSFVVDASSREAFAYVSLSDGREVQVQDAESSTEWDLAFRRTLIRTNGGASGPGSGGAREAAAPAGEAVVTTGFVTDTLVPPPGPPVPMEQWTPANDVLSNWFDYDPATRTVTPSDTEFVARDRNGRKYRMRIDAWEDGRFEMTRWRVPSRPVIERTQLSATSEQWTYFSLRAGAVIEPDAPEESLDWDIAVRGRALRSNGGDSGPGQGAAQSLGEIDISELVTAPADGYVADSNGENGVMTEGAVLGEVIALRLADGSFGKIAFEVFEDGTVEFDHAFAGPGTRSFQ